MFPLKNIFNIAPERKKGGESALSNQRFHLEIFLI
jgi:hypothetical protein